MGSECSEAGKILYPLVAEMHSLPSNENPLTNGHVISSSGHELLDFFGIQVATPERLLSSSGSGPQTSRYEGLSLVLKRGSKCVPHGKEACFGSFGLDKTFPFRRLAIAQLHLQSPRQSRQASWKLMIRVRSTLLRNKKGIENRNYLECMRIV